MFGALRKLGGAFGAATGGGKGGGGQITAPGGRLGSPRGGSFWGRVMGQGGGGEMMKRGISGGDRSKSKGRSMSRSRY